MTWNEDSVCLQPHGMADTAEDGESQAHKVARAQAPETGHEFSSLRHEFNYYSRFLQPLAATLPSAQGTRTL